jgi:hypothetical protein
VLNAPSEDKVLEELKASRVVHFDCHEVSVAEDPSGSCLLRNGPDGNLQQLTVRELAKISFQQAQLAYLSAVLQVGGVAAMSPIIVSGSL